YWKKLTFGTFTSRKDGHAVRVERCGALICRRGETRDFTEIAVQMLLIAVAGLQRETCKGNTTSRLHPRDHALQAEHAAVGLGRATDRVFEQRDEATLTMAARRDDTANLGAAPESLERLGPGGVQPPHTRQTLEELRFEEIRSFGRFLQLEQPLP